MATTPNMGIIKPVPLSDTNLAGATEVNAGFDVIDAHNHTAGLGVQIPTLGLNINADLPLNGFGAINTRYVQLNNLTTPLTAGSFKGYIYTAVGSGTGTFDLFYNDGNGANIQLTKSGGVNLTTTGNISNLNPPASASFGAGTFVWQANTNVPAVMDSGDLIVRKAGATGPLGITITTVNSLAGAYSLTLPSALPGSTLPVQMSSTGQLSTGTISGAQIGATTVAGSNLVNNTITATQLANASVGQAQKAGVPESVSSTINASASNTAYTLVGSVAVTSTGRPSIISLAAAASGTAYVGSHCTATRVPTFISSTWGWSLDNGVSYIYESELRMDIGGSGSAAMEIRNAPGVLNFVRTIPAGNQTVYLFAKVDSLTGSHTWNAVNCAIKVDEL